MTKEYLPHIACYICGELVFNHDAVEIDGIHLCKKEKCREDYLYSTEPRPTPKWNHSAGRYDGDT